ncbi:hypothetical protein RNJ44_04528 [Nakaseomyces bracarensis]|uniref:Uncharacterized protein n=1 Tax=Nakaseomyces bracarensis TaxID=273131 RepID=A0ABR4NV55_9SACH
MDEDEDVVLGSETGDHEILFQQEWERNGTEETETNSVRIVEDIADIAVQDEGLRWSLRKRKAIQKMPYSMDRIKHKQLLQGYDVSIDMNSSQVPRKGRKDRVDTYFELSDDSDSESDFDDSAEIKDTQDLQEDEDGSDPESDSLDIPHHVKHKRLFLELDEDEDEVDAVTIDSSREIPDHDEQIVFRGKKLNLSTGYKGILPKSVWMKTLKGKNAQSKDQSSKRDTRYANMSSKGVAKRRKVQLSTKSENMLDDIIEVDNVEFNNDLVLENYATPRNPVPNMDELEHYYNNKYSGAYNEDFQMLDDPPTGSGLGFSEVIYEDHDISQQDAYSTSESRAIDSMIERAPRMHSLKSNRNPSTKTKKQTNNANKSNSQKRNRVLRINHRSIRKKGSNTTKIAKLNNNEGKNTVTNGKAFVEGLTTADKPVQKPDKKTKKTKLPFGILPPENSVFKKGVHTFNTVVEKTGNNIILQRQSTSDLYSNSLKPDRSDSERGSFLSQCPAIQALIYHKIVSLPDSVKVTVGGKTFVLSRLDTDELQNKLVEIFSTIVEVGASDEEIFQSNIGITTVLLFLNIPSVFDVVNGFHREFRSKLTNLHQKSKPIHFFQLIICQLMLYEISKYANSANKVRESNCNTILNHIVSFFKLFDICYEIVSSQPNDYLNESFHILSMIVDDLDIKAELWERLRRNSFSSSIALILVSIFPTLNPHWDIIFFENNYDSLSKTFRFIKYCNSHYNWDFEDILLLQISRIYKERRFEDFSEEIERSQQNHVISSPLAKIKKLTLFNRYLTILQKTEISDGLIEKITPMSDILVTDTINILMNRVNLIIILSWFSNLNIEKRLNELLKGLISKDYINSKDDNTARLITRSILESFLALIRTSVKNNTNISSKNNIFYQIFKEYIMEREILIQLWSSFLISVRKIASDLPKKNLRNILKLLINTIVIDDEMKRFSKPNSIIMSIFIPHLDYFDDSWIQSRLLSIVERPAKTEKRWINYYCRISKHLIRKSIITFWTFFQYSGIEKDNKNYLYFVNQAVNIADFESLRLIKNEIYDILIGLLYSKKELDYYALLSSILTKDSGTQLEFYPSNDETHLTQITKWLIKILFKYNLYQKVNAIIKETINAYGVQTVTSKHCTDITRYIDTYYRDFLDNYQDLSNLKRQLGIIDSKDDLTLFKEAFKSLDNFRNQMLFLERHVVSVLEEDSGECHESRILQEKILNLLCSPILKNQFKVMKTLFENNIFLEDSHEMSFKSQNVTLYLLKILHEYLNRRLWILESEEHTAVVDIFKCLLSSYPRKRCIIPKLFDSLFSIVEKYLDDILYGEQSYSELESIFLNSFETTTSQQTLQIDMKYDFAKILRDSKLKVDKRDSDEDFSLNNKIANYLEKHRNIT